MRPYLSIIKDSFRAALASRVLYVLLVCITVFLLLLAPFWIKEGLDWEIQYPRHVRNPDALCMRLAEAGPNEQEELVHHIWDKLPEELREQMTKFRAHDIEMKKEDNPGQEDPFGETGAFRRQNMWLKTIEELNNIIQTEDFYQEDLFKDRYLPPEAQGLVDEGVETLTEAQVFRLNRKLMEYSLGGFIRQGPPSSLTVSYLFWSWDELKFNNTRAEMKKTIATWLPWVLDKGVLWIGLLIAVMITASLIPEMLQASSLNLLLSKPVTRWGLLLSKFAGGCAFIAILATYLFVGLWLILGIRIGFWDKAILLSIPVYIFVFAIYFSVSTLVGVLFRNTIVSILLTLLFWVCCWSVGTMFGFFDSRMKASDIVQVVEAQEDLFHVDKVAVPYKWNEEKWQWEMAMADDASRMFSSIFYVAAFFGGMNDAEIPPAIGPAYDPKNDIVVMGQVDLQRPETMDERKFAVTNKEQNWEVTNAGFMPRNTVELYTSNQVGLVAVTNAGRFFRLKENPLQAVEEALKAQQALEPAPAEETEEKQGAQAPETQIRTVSNRKQIQFEIDDELKPEEILELELFQDVSSGKRIDIIDARLVDFNPANNKIAVFCRGTVSIFNWNGDRYEPEVDLTPKLEVDASMTAWLLYRGNTILIGLGNGEVVTLDGNTYKELNTYLPENRSAISSVNGSPDGRWFVVSYRNGTLWYLDTDNPDVMRKAKVRGQGDISTGVFNADNQLWVADRTDRLTLYDPSNWSRIKTYSAKGNTLTKIYRYGVEPLYYAFPKPGEFYKLVSHLSDSSTVAYQRDLDLTTQEEPTRPWDPFRSGLIFLVLMLVIACLIFTRQEY